MNDQTLFKRIAAISAIVSAPVALGSWVLAALAIGADVDSSFNLSQMLTLGSPAAGYLHLAWTIADSFGYLVLLAPAALYTASGHKLRFFTPQKPQFVTVFSISLELAQAAQPCPCHPVHHIRVRPYFDRCHLCKPPEWAGATNDASI
ncbi:MAG: hypothetical protein L0Z71_04590 [Anaerolineae bacterium]|nr:hypothetical protein [Anaerolineae bacterium]